MSTTSKQSAPICFVSMDNLNRVPYIATYVSWIESPFDVIYWDRSGVNDTVGELNAFRYLHSVNASADGGSKLQKLLGYIGFRSYARRILKHADYKLVFALTGNCAVLISDVLMSRFRGRYVIDIRDYWHEDFKLYHNREQKCIESSAAAVISSPAYKSFLREHDFLIMHNDQLLDERTIRKYRMKDKASNPFIISCIGAMKNPEYDKRVIDYFANDCRFKLRFVGRGYELLGDYCIDKGITNVDTTGAFPMDKTLEQYEGTDAILNMYGNHSPYWDYALSNKLYFAARLGLPILVCPDTAMSEYSRKYAFGYEIDFHNTQAKEKLLAAYESSVVSRRHAGCDEFLSLVDSDMEKTKKRVSMLARKALESE